MIYKTYLSHYLAINGHRCYLGSKSDISYLMRKLKNYIYLDKGYHKGVSEKIYNTIKDNNGIIVSLDEEGAVDFNDNSTLFGRYSSELFNHVDCVFFWGIYQYEIIKKQMLKKSKFLVSGHPRFELLKPRFHSIYNEEVRKIKKKFNDFILINTNMSFGNNIKGDDFVLSNYGGRFKNIDQIIAFDKKKLDAFKTLITRISKLNRNIVIRPHPEENISFYINSFINHKNVNVVYEGSVVPWLLSSNSMIHPDCTTALEYLFIGKNPISYLPKGYNVDLVTKLPLKSSLCFTNEDEVIEYIKNSDTLNNKVDINNYPLIEKYFSYSKPSTKLIVEEINNLSNKNKHADSTPLQLNQKFYLLLKSLRASIVINRASSKLIKNKLKGLSHSNVINLSSKFRELDKNLNNIKLRKVNKTLFLFE